MSSRVLTVAWRSARVLIAALLVYLVARTAGIDELGAIRELRHEWLAVALALVPISVGLRAFNHGLLLNSHGKLLDFWQLFRLTLVGAGIGLLLPMGAADLLKARYGLAVHGHAEEMVVSSVFDKLTSLTALALLGTLGALATGDTVLALAAGAIAVGTLVPIWLPVGGIWRLLLRVLAPRTALDAEALARQARPAIAVLVRVWTVSLGAWIVTYMVVYSCCLAVGAPIGVLTVFAVGPLSNVVRLIPVSVGGIGLGEVTLAALLSRAGVPQALSAQVALLQLTLLVLLPGLGGLLLLARGRTRTHGNEVDVPPIAR